jgi:CDP-diacylglycerol---glycerol-3-phosphate 3-phosphatidyltransferase
MPEKIWTLPNILTLVRIVLTPVIALLPFINGYVPKVAAFAVFLIAATSDILDGHFARGRNEITDLGKMLDPLADKLLLFATLVPIYWMTNYGVREYQIPWWGSFPLWVAVLIVGREVTMTVFRQVAARRGVVIAAAGAGKLKTIVQDIFIGGTIGWFAWKDVRDHFGLQRLPLSRTWTSIHGEIIAITLGIAVFLTVYSLLVYIYRYRQLFRGASGPAGRRDGP